MSPASTPLLSARSLVKSYGARRVLDTISLDIRPGERIALCGPSGSGKTTLLNCLGGVDRPDTGEITFQGRRLDLLDAPGLARVRRSSLGTVFQFFHLLPTLTAWENIELPLQLNAVPLADRRARVAAALDRVGLASRAQARPAELSGGEQQRIALARALIHNPPLVLADEPTGNLDSANGAKVLRLLQDLTSEHGSALLLVTHSEEAAAICERRIHLRDGRIESDTACA